MTMSTDLTQVDLHQTSAEIDNNVLAMTVYETLFSYDGSNNIRFQKKLDPAGRHYDASDGLEDESNNSVEAQYPERFESRHPLVRSVAENTYEELVRDEEQCNIHKHTGKCDIFKDSQI